ncbi:hypothetical protein [Hyphomonas jannaschiana]|uniref:Uncharacterized protein n=1 Tax=Hyphomonas jannaschiana VP2 TaxID=1280952 RepID=A0A059FG48_9PROT|nr:hypothetical protein [Hyphomonas jannaschiana]KCZ89567.1 hypothetical protein HJA_04927 [Hyphomonas jannaschiana VP2]
MLDFLWKNAVFNLVYGPLILGVAILLSIEDRTIALFLGVPLIAASLLTITIRVYLRRRARKSDPLAPDDTA